MKYIPLLFLSIFLSIGSSAQYFEGTITYKTTEIPSDKFTEMFFDTTWTYTIKDDKIRSEYDGQFFDYYLINSNTESGDISVNEIDTIKKIYKIVLIKVKDEDYDTYSLGKTAKYKNKKRKNQKILGYNCKHYYYKKSNSRYDFWITDSILPKINGFGYFVKDRGIILRSIFETRSRVIIEEAVSIKSKKINPELFKIPADCKPKNSKSLIKAMKKYGVDEKYIPRDSLRNVKDTTKTKIDLGKWE